MNAAIPIQFEFVGSKEPTLNRVWLEELLHLSNSPNGLRIVPEPPTVRPVLAEEGSGEERPHPERPQSSRLTHARVGVESFHRT